jgi:hypothetical protein
MNNFGRSITQKLSQDYELISTSFHEAGHTICGLLFFARITAVTVNYTAKSVEGYTHYEIIDTHFNDESVIEFLKLAEISISYAGLAAEKIYYKDICGSDKFPMMLRDGSSHDILNAADVIKKFNFAPPGKKRYLFKKKISRNLKILLQEHWDAVRLVAHALYAKKKLSHDDLKDLLTKRSKNKEFWKNRFKEINLIFDSSKTPDLKTTQSILIRQF